MPLIKKFEDILAWQEARKLVSRVYRLTRTGDLSKDFGLRDQLQRAAVSVMNNIAEGFDCESNVEFARFLIFSRRSAVEVQSLLYAACDIGYTRHGHKLRFFIEWESAICNRGHYILMIKP